MGVEKEREGETGLRKMVIMMTSAAETGFDMFVMESIEGSGCGYQSRD